MGRSKTTLQAGECQEHFDPALVDLLEAARWRSGLSNQPVISTT
jgi:hypothetical protein